jgi:hypothetical protein
MFNFHIESDLFFGLGIRRISSEYWGGLVIHLPFISIMITRPVKLIEDDIEERRRF